MRPTIEPEPCTNLPAHFLQATSYDSRWFAGVPWIVCFVSLLFSVYLFVCPFVSIRSDVRRISAAPAEEIAAAQDRRKSARACFKPHALDPVDPPFRLLKGEGVDISIPGRMDVNLQLWCEGERGQRLEEALAGQSDVEAYTKGTVPEDPTRDVAEAVRTRPTFTRPMTLMAGGREVRLHCEAIDALILEQRDLTFGKRMQVPSAHASPNGTGVLGERASEGDGVTCACVSVAQSVVVSLFGLCVCASSTRTRVCRTASLRDGE